MTAQVVALPVSEEPLPPLSEMGPLSDREQRIYALAYTAGREDEAGDAYDHGFLAGVTVASDAALPTTRSKRVRPWYLNPVP